jgi:hypothetical protein
LQNLKKMSGLLMYRDLTLMIILVMSDVIEARVEAHLDVVVVDHENLAADPAVHPAVEILKADALFVLVPPEVEVPLSMALPVHLRMVPLVLKVPVAPVLPQLLQPVV